MKLYAWQQECLKAWEANRCRGIAHVVTGAGKTLLALNAMDLYLAYYPDARIRIVVPTIALAQQWQTALLHHVKSPEFRPGFFGGGVKTSEDRRVVIYIVNSARDALEQHVRRDFALGRHVLLICDECHHYQSPGNRQIFAFLNSSFAKSEQYAALGLSATPFGTAHDEILTEALGPEIYRYDTDAAVGDGIVTPFTVGEIAVSFLPEEKKAYQELSLELMLLLKKLLKAHPELEHLSPSAFLKAVTKLAHTANMDPENPAAAFLLTTWKRKEISVLADARILCGLTLIEQLPAADRILVFCERISQAEHFARAVRKKYGNICSIYHSGLSGNARNRNMSDFRENRVRILIACRCLDEGLDVPDASVGIILSSSAVSRQRVQRLGRILRRADGKHAACLYYLYIQESAEDSAFLPGLSTGKNFNLRFDSLDRSFENDLYVYAAMNLMQKAAASGLNDAQLKELRACLMEGLSRSDYLLDPDVQNRLARSASSRHMRNYWQTMRKIGSAFMHA